MAYWLRGHPGSGDHGWEDRVRGTCTLLGDVELSSARPEEDWHYGVKPPAGIRRERPEGCLRLTDEGGRTLLWDWAEGYLPKSRGFSGIFVPDRYQFSRFEATGMHRNLHLGPDPLFLVSTQSRQGEFGQAPMALCPGGVSSYVCWKALGRWVLAQREFSPFLLPYRRRDARVQQVLAADLGIPARPDGSAPELRGDLSHCACVIGVPSAVMAGWSCGVPGLCIGANPRAMGLATELFGGWNCAVVPMAALHQAQDWILAVRCFLATMDAQRKALETAVPLRRAQSLAWEFPSILHPPLGSPKGTAPPGRNHRFRPVACGQPRSQL